MGIFQFPVHSGICFRIISANYSTCAVYRANFGLVLGLLIRAIQDPAIHLKLCALGQNTHVFAVFHTADQEALWPAGVRRSPDQSELAVVSLTASTLTLLWVRDLRQVSQVSRAVIKRADTQTLLELRVPLTRV